MKNIIMLMSALLFGSSLVFAGGTFYTDKDTFESQYPGLSVEDYSSTNVPPNSMAEAVGPFNSLTDNACFSPGDIVEGLSLNNLEGIENVVLTPPYEDVSSVTVGPINSFGMGVGVYSFATPVKAFAIELLIPYGGEGTIGIDLYRESGSLLATTFSNATQAGVFWGVYSDEPIGSIEFWDIDDQGHMFANVQFGSPSALERNTWGSLKVKL